MQRYTPPLRHSTPPAVVYALGAALAFVAGFLCGRADLAGFVAVPIAAAYAIAYRQS